VKRSRRSTAIVSRLDDPRIQPILALHSRSERDRRRQFYVEGMRFISRAMDGRCGISTLVTAPALAVHPFGRELIERNRALGRLIVETTPDVFRLIGFGAEPQGIGAVVRQRWTDLSALNPEASPVVVALSTIRSPGNLGTIIRTCESAGATLALLDRDPDPHDPRAVRATMGSVFGVRIVRADLRLLREWAHRQGGTVVGTSPGALCDFRHAEYGPPVVLLMGGERRGLSAAETARCDAVVRIPMAGQADSLNLAVATGIVLYEAIRPAHD
jgi:TrmH family RNA methyltransferase